MATLIQTAADDQTETLDITIDIDIDRSVEDDLSADDLAWYAAHSSEFSSGEPDPIDDLEWLSEEAADLDATPGSTGAGTVAAVAIRETAGHLARSGRRSVVDFGGKGRDCVGSRYDEIRPRSARMTARRRTELALALDALAAWYDHLDTPAGRFAAAAIQAHANHADGLGSATAAEYERDDVEYEQAMSDRAATIDHETGGDPCDCEECERRGF